jgi:hypothetical protein
MGGICSTHGKNDKYFIHHFLTFTRMLTETVTEGTS